MPQFFIEAPTGVRSEAKQKMMKEITAAIDAAYHIPDVRIWLREYAPDQVAQDGRLAAEPIRPLCFLEAPELASLDAKRRMAGKIHTAIAEAYDGIANTEETLIL
ncbi:tautomerase family protein [Nonomuraea dietziae]